MADFPDNFLWGAATSAHQVEGNNSFNDWWAFEQSGKLKYRSGLACRHYDLFEGDFDLAKELNHSCHRLSIEWSRIEPEEGKFCYHEIEHYKKVITALKSRGLEPVVTLHHFTIPLWLSEEGSWSSKKAPGYFLRYVGKVIEALAGDVRYWVTINEPMVYLYYSYLLGLWPPQEKSIFKTRLAQANLLSAHISTYRFIKNFYLKSKLDEPMISIAQNMQAFVPCKPTLRNKLAAHLRAKFYNLEFIERSFLAGALDYIGVNYYSRSLVELRGWGIKNFTTDTCNENHSNLRKNSLGWEVYPEGLQDVLFSLKKYKLPVFILENGICTDNDSLRWDFIREHLASITRSISSGVRVCGYIYWSLIDNYEWDKGFAPRFGLVDVDYNTFKRTVRESAKKLAKVSLENRI